MQAGDAVLGAPAAQGLVALQPDQGLGSVDAGAQEGGGGGRGAGAGEVQPGGPGGLCRAFLFVGVLAGAGRGDDVAFFVALDAGVS
ncbi:hypothetical protein [Streptomyces roseolus]|uniref:hypothetical protein n=1 Tax=Streptomyces roseolus TaxID=67358 RepID=UPI0016785F98